MPSRLLPLAVLSLVFANPAFGQDSPKLPKPDDLLPLVPSVSTANNSVRSFAFDALLHTGDAEGMRTRGWYSGPGQMALLILDEGDSTPLLFASGGKGVVYDALERRCLTFSYGSLSYRFGLQDKTSLIMGGGMTGEKGVGRFDIDLHSLFDRDSTTVEADGDGAYRLTTTGGESRAAIRLTPSEVVPWGRFTLAPADAGPDGRPLLVIDLVDVNRDVPAGRLAFPALEPTASKLDVKPFPSDDAELDRMWKTYLDGARAKLPPDASSKLDSDDMKAVLLAQMLVYRSHFIRMGLRDPKARAKVESGLGDNPIIPKEKKLNWDTLAESDRTISTALREALARQTPLREPRSAADVRAEAEGKKLFEALEQKLAGAKGYRVEYESEVLTSMSHGRVKGTLALAPGNRMKLVNEFAPTDPLLHEPDGKMTFVSDGKTLVLYNTATGKPGKTEPVMDRVQETLSAWLIRIGVFYTVMGHTTRDGDNDYRELKMSDFKLAGKEKVNGREANIVTFTLTKGMVGKTSHKLWLDLETGLPLKQVVETQDRFGVAETYRNWELSPALPEETFALPK